MPDRKEQMRCVKVIETSCTQIVINQKIQRAHHVSSTNPHLRPTRVPLLQPSHVFSKKIIQRALASAQYTTESGVVNYEEAFLYFSRIRRIVFVFYRQYIHR